MPRSRTLGWTSARRRDRPGGRLRRLASYSSRTTSTADNAQGAPGRDGPSGPSIATVEKTDFPIYLTGLGTVQGFNTVVVRTRVDGQIDKIAFKEGQLVKKGDLLAQIDPRPFQAALDQAKAKKTQDEANLANAKLDLAALHQARRIRDQAADRHAALHGAATHRTDRGRRCRDLQCADPARLYHASARRSRASPASARSTRATSSTRRHRPGIVTIAQIEPIAVIFTAPEEHLPDIKDALAADTAEVIALIHRRQEGSCPRGRCR